MYVSLSSLIAFIISWAIIVWGILSSSSFWQVFLNGPSLIIVIGLTITSIFIGYRFIDVSKSLIKVFTLLIYQPFDIKKLRHEIMLVVGWSSRVQSAGMTVYDEISSENKDVFIKYLCAIIGTGYSEKEVRSFLETNIEESYSRDYYNINVLEQLGAYSPAFGMLGTLIGLIVLLSQLDDPSKIGLAMAIALVTTFYGLILARIVFLPAASKLERIAQVSRLRKQIVLEGAILIMQEKSSFYIEDKLNSYLDQSLKSSVKEFDESLEEEEIEEIVE